MIHPLLFVGTTFATGGAERIFYYLARGLNRPPFGVEVLALRRPGPIGDELAAGGIPVHSGFTGSGRIDAALVFKISRLLRQRRYEGIYFLDHAHAVFYTTLASLSGSVEARVMPVHTMRQWDDRPSIRRPIRLVMQWLHRILAIAEAQKRYLVEEEGIPAEKIVVIPNGIPLSRPGAAARAALRREVREELGIPQARPVVGITAVLRPEKNHELLLQAFGSLRTRFPEAELWIVGDGPRRPQLQRAAREAGLTEAVRFLGHRPDAPRVMAGMDVAALSSHPRVETLPLSLLEAMDAGIPVVATRVGALHEMVEEGRSGFLVPPGEAQPLAQALARVLEDPALRERMGLRGQAIAEERYSIEGMVDATGRLLCRLLQIDEARWSNPAPSEKVR